jgi:glycosidase
MGPYWLLVAALLAAATGCGPERTDESSNRTTEEVDRRPVVYQLVVRYFGNTKGTNAYNGDLVTNGVGKFAHINDAALESLSDLGVTHIWLTGVLQHATNTDYSHIGQPPDDPDVLKGKAGSFFAVRDYFDVSPDYALDPARRMEEFEALVDRIHDHDMKVMIDLVPNHVARTYHSDIKPQLDFGADDNRETFFERDNNFYYLVDPPGQSLQLPNPENWERPEGADGTLEREDNDGMPEGDVPKVTGNNQATAAPSTSDWYETVKLNYGYNFATGEMDYEPTPDTWNKMDRVIAYWQNKGVDGFRADFAHLVPVQAWEYLLGRARDRDDDAYFIAEAYRSSRAPPGFSLANLVQVGFDAVYDDATFDTLKEIYCCEKWANDLADKLPGDFMFDKYLRYGENHDERRIASPVVEGQPHDSGFGSMRAGKPAVGTSFLLGSGPMLVFNGQTVGEPGAGTEGFDGDDGRTTIFDYWTMPEMAKWVNDHEYDGGGLSDAQRQHRQWYADLIEVAQRPGFASGEIYVLQSANADSEGYTEGHWIFSFLRYDSERDATWLVVANYDDQPHQPRVRIPSRAHEFTGLDDYQSVQLVSRLGGGSDRAVATDQLHQHGVELQLDGRDLRVFEFERQD